MDQPFNAKDEKTLRRLVSILNGGELTKDEFVKAFEQVVQIVLNIETRLVTRNNEEIVAMKTEADTTKENIKGDYAGFKKNANDFIAKLISDFKESITERLDDIDGDLALFRNERWADKEVLFSQLSTLLPTIEQIGNDLPQLGARIRDGLELLQGDERLDVSAIKGWEKLQADIAAAKKSGKPVSFVGGARGIYLFVGGVKKGIVNTLDFVAGSGMSISYGKVNGRDTITFDSSGGGVTVETPPEPPAADGSVLIFTVSAQPKWVVSDGTTLYAGAGYSYAAGHVTLINGPTSFIRAII